MRACINDEKRSNTAVAIFEKIILLLHTHVLVRSVKLGCYVTGVWMANCFYVMARMWHCITLPSLAVAGELGKRHARRAHKAQAVCDWLNPNSLGTMSAFRIHRELSC